MLNLQNQDLSIYRKLQSLETSLNQQTKVFFPWTTQKCTRQMQCLLDSIREHTPEKSTSKKIYSYLKEPNCESLFKKPPWFINFQHIFCHIFGIKATDESSRGQELVQGIHMHCLLSFKEEIHQGLHILLTADVAPRKVLEAAEDLLLFLEDPLRRISNYNFSFPAGPSLHYDIEERQNHSVMQSAVSTEGKTQHFDRDLTH